ncbi:hypothetical protein J7E97_09785 [Streptomyces sp. ISL-66]|uniref:hypothetical protein n=1 Tax=Streptomyces sp. ISL-66 TaxID=2819186 RepID=UPI001BECC21C|nr:hypothetical protein [Streptomyces sp. ISL-66]MBT2468162.1 hypothetical protein [Streptomyces sp. ISL-66]
MTTTLMTYAGPGEPEALATRTGGSPLAPPGTAWPRCATCGGAMRFLAQIVPDEPDRPIGRDHAGAGLVLAVFMCQNDPGMCEEWSPTAGGNRALLFPSDALRPMPVPEPEGEGGQGGDGGAALRLGAVNAVTLVSLPTDDYAGAREEWAGRSGNDPANVLGQLGGRPDWIQGDETPTCPDCARPMDLVAQLEEGPDHATAMNFGGGGSAYAFACGPCARAVFLWQC